jgi:hypothetical protein
MKMDSTNPVSCVDISNTSLCRSTNLGRKRNLRKMAEIVRNEKAYNNKGKEICAPVVKCSGCGEEVICADFTNTCACGMEYNFAGQTLKPRDQWEEEY